MLEYPSVGVKGQAIDIITCGQEKIPLPSWEFERVACGFGSISDRDGYAWHKLLMFSALAMEILWIYKKLLVANS